MFDIKFILLLYALVNIPSVSLERNDEVQSSHKNPLCNNNLAEKCTQESIAPGSSKPDSSKPKTLESNKNGFDNIDDSIIVESKTSKSSKTEAKTTEESYIPKSDAPSVSDTSKTESSSTNKSVKNSASTESSEKVTISDSTKPSAKKSAPIDKSVTETKIDTTIKSSTSDSSATKQETKPEPIKPETTGSNTNATKKKVVTSTAVSNSAPDINYNNKQYLHLQSMYINRTGYERLIPVLHHSSRSLMQAETSQIRRPRCLVTYFINSDGNRDVVRGCSYASEQPENRCLEAIGDKGDITMTSCLVCNSHRCNTASRTTNTIFVFIVSVVFSYCITLFVQ